MPSQAYYALALGAGCGATTGVNGTTGSVFACLVAQNASIIAAAANNISQEGAYGNWAFDPVIDGIFVEQAPSQALLQKKVNGVRLLSGVSSVERSDETWGIADRVRIEQRQRRARLHAGQHHHRGPTGQLDRDNIAQLFARRRFKGSALLPWPQLLGQSQRPFVSHPGLHGTHRDKSE